MENTVQKSEVCTQATIEGKRVYISGPISGVSDFKTRFQRVEDALRDLNPKQILNPANLPEGWTYKQYMEACCTMVFNSEAIVMLDGWAESMGAKAELALAASLKLPVFKASSFREVICLIPLEISGGEG